MHAKDKATGKEQKITITASSGLSDSEIDQMVKDAEQHAEDDAAKKKEIEVRNSADSMVYQMEKMLADTGDKISDDDKKTVEMGIQSVKDALAGDDVAAIEAAVEGLTQASHKMAEQMYAAAGGAEAAPEPEAAPAEDDDVIDAEFTES